MNEVKVTLGGKDYGVKPLRYRESKAWRETLAGPLGQILSLLRDGPNVELTDLQAVAELVNVAGQTVLTAPDLVLDCLMDYSPELAADRSRIEQEAYDAEIVTAFVEVLKLAFPFGAVSALVRGTGSASR